MIRERALRAREKLVGKLPISGELLRGSLLERTVRHTKDCPKCARGEGHKVFVLTVTYPGGRTRQISVRRERIAEVYRWLSNYQELKEAIEAICELNHERDRRFVADRAVWTHFVVVSTPILHFLPCVVKAQEPVRVQTFGSEATFEGFDERIVRRLTWSGEVERDAAVVGPAVVGPQIHHVTRTRCPGRRGSPLEDHCVALARVHR